MRNCPYCGRELPSIVKGFCPFCGNSLGFVNSQVTIATTSMPEMSKDEKCVKTYHCAKMRGINGFLTVTNKRVIFHSYANQYSFTSEEVVLDSISGLHCLRGRNYSIFRMLIGIILAILGIVLIFKINTLVGILLMAIGALIIWLSIRNTYSLKIFSSKAESSPIDLGRGATSLLGNRALMSVTCDPTADTYKMIQELGALILDLQTYGDLAINEWQSKK